MGGEEKWNIMKNEVPFPVSWDSYFQQQAHP